jgi:purine-binding chemotaxis protein CheW
MTTQTLETRTDAPPLSAQVDEPDSSADTRQLVVFHVEEEVFAVDLAPVQEIIRLPEVVRVPLAPASLDGLANLRGRVLPIVSLRRMFGFPEIEHNDATRAVVVDVGQPLGFVVDRVASVLNVEASRLESADKIRSTIDTDLLTGIVKEVGGYSMVMVLDFGRLIRREFSQISAVSQKAEAALQTASSESQEEEETSDERQLVSFEVAAQEYAIAIEDVQEIVQVPSAIIHVPHSQQHVLGIITLRNRLLPLVNLRRIFALADRALDEKSRIVVLTQGGASVGVVVDGVREVLRVGESGIGAIPPLLAHEGNLADISGICRLDDGKRLVSIVTATNLFDHSTVKEALNAVKDAKPDSVAEDSESGDAIDDIEQTVVFRLDKEEFGVPIASVQEIVRVPEEMTRVHNAQSYVEGVINLRGTVLPVVDLRSRFGMERSERSDRQRIMVFLLDGTHTGFVVDQVAEVLRIPRSAIEPAPRLSRGQDRLLSRMANLEKSKRMIQLIDPAHLVEAQGVSGPGPV